MSFQPPVVDALSLRVVVDSRYERFLPKASHPLVQKLDGSPHFHDLAHILFDQALLAEGGMPEDPAEYVRRVNALLA